MKIKLLILPILLIFLMACMNEPNIPFNGASLSIPSTDGLELNTDYYEVEETNKPLILLFHQARFSRGEYRAIAPNLNALGFSCMAIDQRSGETANGIDNEAYKQAVAKGLDTDYVDALPDLRATIDYALEHNIAEEFILVGSSYSSSLIFILATEYPDEVKGVIAFSPGEYFVYNEKEVVDYAGDLVCPVFITSSKDEEENWKSIYDNVNAKKSFYLPDFEGYHGAKALWKEHEGNEKYWTALKTFLSNY